MKLKQIGTLPITPMVARMASSESRDASARFLFSKCEKLNGLTINMVKWFNH